MFTVWEKSVAEPYSKLACVDTLACHVTVVLIELTHVAMVASDEYSLAPADGAAVVGGVGEEVEEGHGLLSCVPSSYSTLLPISDPQCAVCRLAHGPGG